MNSLGIPLPPNGEIENNTGMTLSNNTGMTLSKSCMRDPIHDEIGEVIIQVSTNDLSIDDFTL